MPVPDNWPLELKNAMGSGKVRMLPREAQDYRDANILLYRRISAMTTKLPAPLSSATPALQLETMRRENPDDLCLYWPYPLAAARQIPGFNQMWLLPAKGKK